MQNHHRLIYNKGGTIMNHHDLTIISQAMTKPIFSLALSGHILGIMKKRLMAEANFESFPLLVLIGAPQTGKSAVFRAAIPDETHRKSTFDGFREIKKFIQTKDTEYILIDDVSTTKNNSKKQQYARILDDIGRASYEGSSCIIGMTMEETTLRYFPTSCIQRMLLADTNDFWNRENQQFTKELRQCSATLKILLDAFRDWFAKQTTSFADNLNHYESLHLSEMEKHSRLVHTTFAYWTAVEYYFKFLRNISPAVYDELHISVKNVLTQLVTPFFDPMQTTKMKRIQLFMQSLYLAIQSPTLVVQKPEPFENLCKAYAYGTCLQCQTYSGFSYNYDCQYDDSEISHCYNPADLVIRTNYNALFLKDARQVPIFPKHLKDTGSFPVLLIHRDVLLDLINRACSRICHQEQKQTYPFHMAEMTKYLYQLNMLLFLPGAKNNRYSIPHYYECYEENKNVDISPLSVFIIRLTPEIAEVMDKNIESFCPKPFQQGYAKEMAKNLSYHWYRLVATYGAIGVYDESET